ncbi:MAG TPA: hypothetical protein V6D03_15140 [Candidatus Caenarcaniphilales bacterium]
MKVREISPLLAFLALFSTAICWRGIWGLFDVYLFPENPSLSYLLSLGLGLCGFWMFDFLKPDQK